MPVITGTKNIIVKRNCKVDLFAYVKGHDYDGQPLIVIANDINTSVCGTYEVVYQTTGKYGATIYETATITVVEELEKTK